MRIARVEGPLAAFSRICSFFLDFLHPPSMISTSFCFLAVTHLLGDIPQKALCRGIPGAVLEPLVRFWSHFVGIYRQNLTRSLEN